MAMRTVTVLLAGALASCATTPPPSPAVAEEEPSPAPVHHHHHHRHLNPDGTSCGPDGQQVGTGTAFGTPLAPSAHGPEIVPRWTSGNGSDGRIVCDGNEREVAPQCPQCADTPGTAAIVQAFVPAENAVLRCEPPANPLGRLPVRVTFGSAGVPLEIRSSRGRSDGECGHVHRTCAVRGASPDVSGPVRSDRLSVRRARAGTPVARGGTQRRGTRQLCSPSVREYGRALGRTRCRTFRSAHAAWPLSPPRSP